MAKKRKTTKVPIKEVRIVSSELHRQFNLLNENFDALDKKISLILGFVIVFVGQLILNDSFVSYSTGTLFTSLLFYTSLIMLYLAIFASAKILFGQKYELGPNINDIVEVCEKDGKIDIEREIISKIKNAFGNNLNIYTIRAEYFSHTLIFFFSALALNILIFLTKYFVW